MEFWYGFFAITGAHLLAAVSPGPDFVLISQHTVRHGKLAGIWCSLGIALGLSVHIIYSILGLATLIANSSTLLWVVKVLGGCYLLYLGMQGLRAQPSTLKTVSTVKAHHGKPMEIRHSVLRGFLCNVLNPKAPIYFISIFTVVISPNLPLYQLAIYGVWMMVLQFFWFAFVVMILSWPLLNRRFQCAGHWIERLFGVAMIALGIKVLRL